MRRTRLSGPAYFVVLAVLLAFTLPAFAEAGSKKSKPLEKASKAPEFELPILKLATDDKGNHTGAVTDEKVKLSKLIQQKKTVVLFLSSYT